MDVARSRRPPADVRADRHRSRREDDLGRAARPRPPLPGRTRPPRASRASPKVTGQRGIQIWVPIEPRPHVRRDPHVGRGGLAGVGETVPDLVSAGSGRSGPHGPGPARLHAERDQQDARRAVLARARSRRAGVDADRLGRARRSRSPPRPLDDPHGARPARRATATRLRPLVGRPADTARRCEWQALWTTRVRRSAGRRSRSDGPAARGRAARPSRCGRSARSRARRARAHARSLPRRPGPGRRPAPRGGHLLRASACPSGGSSTGLSQP